MFDFTKEIKLDKKDYSFYRKLQIILYLSAFLLALYLSYLIVFPHNYFFFSFLNPTSPNNNIDYPYFSNKENVKEGKLEKNKNIFFDVNLLDNYSTVKTSLKIANAPNNLLVTLSLRKSYEAFLYDIGDSIGFKDGSLLENDNDFYLVSNGKLRKFNSIEILASLGYSKNQFEKVNENDLKFNQIGENISNKNTYPDSAIFHIDDNFYIIEKQTLKKFISDKAFFSGYNAKQAIDKNSDFLYSYPISDDLIGFADGTLVSNDTSVYIINNKKILPINNPKTFEKNGYIWKDILPIGSDELSHYEKAKIFNIRNPHPDGTIFKTIETDKYYIIKNSKKHPLLSEKIIASWLKKNPVMVSEKSLGTKFFCNFEKKSSQSNIYECEIPLKIFSDLSGFDYRFSLTSNKNLQINLIEIDYKKNINLENFKKFIKLMISRIRLNYA